MNWNMGIEVQRNKSNYDRALRSDNGNVISKQCSVNPQAPV